MVLLVAEQVKKTTRWDQAEEPVAFLKKEC
jgi:hypothetical protein